MYYLLFLSFIISVLVMADIKTTKSDACLSCSTSTCALLPPSNSSFPCYQGALKDSNFCFDTDPLLPDGETWQCGQCVDFGYPSYIQNDPIYKNMELWGVGKV